MFLAIPFIIAFIILLILVPVYKTILQFSQRNRSSIPQSKEESILDELTILLNIEEVSYKNREYTYPEILLMGLAPLVGIILVYAFQKEIKPFDLEYFPLVIPLILVGYISYWVSRIAREDLTESYGSFLMWGMSIGLFFYPILGIHFISSMTVLGVVIFPFLAFALIAPIPCCLFIYTELESRNFSFEKKRWVANPIPLFALVVFLVLVGIVLGYPTDAILQAFTGGEDFMFSNLQKLKF